MGNVLNCRDRGGERWIERERDCHLTPFLALLLPPPAHCITEPIDAPCESAQGDATASGRHVSRAAAAEQLVRPAVGGGGGGGGVVGREADEEVSVGSCLVPS